jgi:TetR/AcrR family transcriptional regulator, cholesterol catabolism regulator
MVEVTRRREIEDAAATLFHARGYAATSVRDIADSLSIRGPSLYAHVASKEDVLAAIVERVASAFERAADEAQRASAALDAGTRLRALVGAHVRTVTADPGAASVFVDEWRHLSEPRREAIHRRRDAYEQRFRQTIADGRSDGSFALVDPVIAATFVLTALNGIADWYRVDGHLSPDQLADAYADLALRSLTEAHR